MLMVVGIADYITEAFSIDHVFARMINSEGKAD